MTQVQAADALGVQQTLMSKTETMDRRLDIIELRDLCNIYGVSIVQFAIRLEVLIQSTNLEGDPGTTVSSEPRLSPGNS